jgi:predicted nucleic acid-binding protein
MVLVDTSVIIDLLKGEDNHATQLFHGILEKKIGYGISVLTYQEVLQGARDASEEMHLQTYLETQKLYMLPSDLAFYNDASRLRRLLRHKGITIRNTIDILIAMTAIWHDLKLLHNDKDFEWIAKEISELKEYR